MRKTIDYTKMELGRVTRTWKGRNVCIIARCPKCGRRGERSVVIPSPDEAWRGSTPYVAVTHLTEVMQNPAGLREWLGPTMRHTRDHCSVKVDKTNVDELLGAEERRRYDAYRDALIARVAEF